jgi:hypothetical protein
MGAPCFIANKTTNEIMLFNQSSLTANDFAAFLQMMERKWKWKLTDKIYHGNLTEEEYDYDLIYHDNHFVEENVKTVAVTLMLEEF